jgi:hypothetical protein
MDVDEFSDLASTASESTAVPPLIDARPKKTLVALKSPAITTFPPRFRYQTPTNLFSRKYHLLFVVPLKRMALNWWLLDNDWSPLQPRVQEWLQSTNLNPRPLIEGLIGTATTSPMTPLARYPLRHRTAGSYPTPHVTPRHQQNSNQDPWNVDEEQIRWLSSISRFTFNNK